MRLLIYEHLTASAGCGPELPASLATEGGAMLRGLLQDCLELAGIEPHTLIGPTCLAKFPAIVHCVDASKGWLQSLRELLVHVDAALIIAPEFSSILETLTRLVEEAGKLLLGSNSTAVAATADKWICGSQCWEPAGMPTPRTVLVLPQHFGSPHELLYPIILKPRDGAGSQSTILIPSAECWDRALATVQSENPSGEWIAQEFKPGLPASVACIRHAKGVLAMPAASQHFSDDGRFYYLGGELPLPPPLCERAQKLATAAVAAIDGLRGYVGVDLVLGAAEDGSRNYAIEINPRITTSYLGLRALCKQNLLGVILTACQQQPIPQLTWQSGTVEFRADGMVGRK